MTGFHRTGGDEGKRHSRKRAAFWELREKGWWSTQSPATQGDGRAGATSRAGVAYPARGSSGGGRGNGILARVDNANVVFCQLVPWQFDPKKQMNLKGTFRRAWCLVTRLAANMGAAGDTPLLARFRSPVEASRDEKRWLDGFYLDAPEEWDDPYRYFRW